MILNKQQNPPIINPLKDQQQCNRTKSDFARSAARDFSSRNGGSVKLRQFSDKLHDMTERAGLSSYVIRSRESSVEISGDKASSVDDTQLNFLISKFNRGRQDRGRDPSRRTRVPEEKLGNAIKTRASLTGDELSMTRLFPHRPWHHRDAALREALGEGVI